MSMLIDDDTHRKDTNLLSNRVPYLKEGVKVRTFEELEYQILTNKILKTEDDSRMRTGGGGGRSNTL